MARRTAGSAVSAGGDPGRGAQASGPHDVEALDPEATVAAGMVDFGALQVPVPEDGTVTVEPTTGGRMQAVHVSVGEGRLSVSALAAPKSARLWPDLAREIDASLKEGGARVRSFPGEWGRELHATTGAATSVFVGVDGPRWMVYGVATGPSRDAVALDARLRRLLRGTVVVRGRSPYPVRTVLPLVVPAELELAAGETPGAAATPPRDDIGARAAGAGSPAPGDEPGAATAAFSAVVRAAQPGPEIAEGAGSTTATPLSALRGPRERPRWAEPGRRVDDPRWHQPFDPAAERAPGARRSGPPPPAPPPRVQPQHGLPQRGLPERGLPQRGLPQPAPPPPAAMPSAPPSPDPPPPAATPGRWPAPAGPADASRPASAPGTRPGWAPAEPAGAGGWSDGSPGGHGSVPGSWRSEPDDRPSRSPRPPSPPQPAPEVAGPRDPGPPSPGQAGAGPDWWRAPATPGELPIFESLLAGEPADGRPGRHAASGAAGAASPVAERPEPPAAGRRRARTASWSAADLLRPDGAGAGGGRHARPEP